MGIEMMKERIKEEEERMREEENKFEEMSQREQEKTKRMRIKGAIKDITNEIGVIIEPFHHDKFMEGNTSRFLKETRKQRKHQHENNKKGMEQDELQAKNNEDDWGIPRKIIVCWEEKNHDQQNNPKTQRADVERDNMN